MWILDGTAVKPYPATFYLDLVAGQADNPLDQVLIALLWMNEHDYITAVDISEMHQVSSERQTDQVQTENRVGQPDPIRHLAHQDVIADEQRRFHGTRRDHVRLYEEGANDQRQSQR